MLDAHTAAAAAAAAAAVPHAAESDGIVHACAFFAGPDGAACCLDPSLPSAVTWAPPRTDGAQSVAALAALTHFRRLRLLGRPARVFALDWCRCDCHADRVAACGRCCVAAVARSSPEEALAAAYWRADLQPFFAQLAAAVAAPE
jgi:hypothetical protein